MDMRTEDMECCGLDMSNFDHAIEEGCEEALRASPAKVYAGYPGYNFYAQVFFENGEFHAEVQTYCSFRGTWSAPALEELMSTVSNRFGWD